MDGPPPPEEDFSQLPVADRLAHKNWKARVSGYETLIKTFQNTASDTDPAFKPYTNSPDTLKKIVTDTNAVAQEKGVEAVVAFVKFAGETAARTREVVVPALVDKCLGSTRAGTRNQAIELALQYVEVENGGAGVMVRAALANVLPDYRSYTQNDLLPGLGAKQPKAVAGCVMAMKEVIKYVKHLLLSSLGIIDPATELLVRKSRRLRLFSRHYRRYSVIQTRLSELRALYSHKHSINA